MIDTQLRPGYNAIKAASKLPEDADGWRIFMKDVLGLPLAMLPSVQRVIKQRIWMRARNPLGCLKESAERDAIRTNLSRKPAAPKGD
jgi:hypothetical protein